MKRSTITTDEISGEGVLFIRNNNLVGCSTCILTDQPFDAAGLFFEDTITGSKKIHYLLIDLLTGMKISNISDYGPTIEDLINSKNVRNIAIRNIKNVLNDDGTIDAINTSKRKEEFRIHITKIISADTKGMAEYIKRLFGQKVNKDGYKYNSIDIVNIMFKLIIGSLTPDWNSTEVNLEQEIIENINGAINNMSVIFAQSIISDADEYNIPIQVHLRDTNLFDILKYINRPYSDSELDEYFKENIETDTAFDDALEIFSESFRTNKNFVTDLISGMQLREDRKVIKTDLYHINLVNSSKLLANYLKTLDSGSDEYKSVYKQLYINGMITNKEYI